MGVVSFMKDSVFADEYAAKKGFLQSLDPRIKAITIFAFMIGVLFTKSLFVAAGVYALCAVLAFFSRINAVFFLKRTWLFIPFFSLFIAVPALFNVFTPGDTLYVFKAGGITFIVTRQGLSGAALFVVRVAASVSYAVLLSITTKHVELLRVLRVFKVPQIFVMTLGMCYRYIYLFADIIENTYRAMQSRAGAGIYLKSGRHIVVWNISALWQRSMHMQSQVYNAMLSRGWRGEPRVIQEYTVSARDRLWLVFSAVVMCIVLWMR